MKITLNIGYKQLITIINQLPKHEVKKLRAEIENILRQKSATTKDLKSEDLEELIVHGPVMNDEKYNDFKEHRKNFNLWRAS